MLGYMVAEAEPTKLSGEHWSYLLGSNPSCDLRPATTAANPFGQATYDTFYDQPIGAPISLKAEGCAMTPTLLQHPELMTLS